MKKGGQENWKQVAGFPNYFVSDLGRIKSEKNRRKSDDGIIRCPAMLRPNKANSVGLRKDGKTHYLKFHRLILEAFKGPPPNDKLDCRHLDDDTSNNKLDNLAWGNAKDNYDDAVRNGSHGPKSPGAILRGNALKGKPRPTWVREKISHTKTLHPERQVYGTVKDPKTGRFV